MAERASERNRYMKKFSGYMSLFIAVSIWSVTFIAIDYCLDYMSPLEVNVLRFSLGALFLWFIQFGRRKRMAFEGKDQFKIAIAGIFGTAGYYYFANVSLAYISPAMVSITAGAIPIITLIVGMLFMGTRTRFRNIVMIFMSFAGIIIMTDPFMSGAEGNFAGIGLVMVGSVCWVIYTLMNEPFTIKYDKLSLLTIQMTYGAAVLVTIYCVQIVTDSTMVMELTVFTENPVVIFYVLFISLLSSVATYHLYNVALEQVGVTISALFINVIPVVALGVSVAAGLEELTLNKVIGCVLVVLAVYLIEDIDHKTHSKDKAKDRMKGKTKPAKGKVSRIPKEETL